MDEGIKIQKTTLMLVVGLVLAVIIGAYIVNASAYRPQTGRDPAGGVATGNGTGSTGAAQEIYLHAKNTGVYDKEEITVKNGIPVRLHFTADPDAGCGRQMVIYGLGVSATSRSGEESIVDFTPDKAGTYEINCGMRMWKPAKLIVQ